MLFLDYDYLVPHTAPFENYNQGWGREEAERKGAPTVQLSANRTAVKLERGEGVSHWQLQKPHDRALGTTPEPLPCRR